MPDPDRTTFAERLKYAREVLRGLTQFELSEKSGILTTTISHFESQERSRKPSFDNLRRLAKALGVSTDYLLGTTDDPVSKAVDDALYRNVKLLNEDDRKLAANMIKHMAERRKKEKNE